MPGDYQCTDFGKENLFEGVNIANLFQSAKFFLPFPTIVPQDSLYNVGRYSE